MEDGASEEAACEEVLEEEEPQLASSAQLKAAAAAAANSLERFIMRYSFFGVFKSGLPGRWKSHARTRRQIIVNLTISTLEMQTKRQKFYGFFTRAQPSAAICCTAAM